MVLDSQKLLFVIISSRQTFKYVWHFLNITTSDTALNETYLKICVTIKEETKSFLTMLICTKL